MTLDKDILLPKVVPQPVNNRGFLGLSNNDILTLIKKMVVYQSCTLGYMIYQKGILLWEKHGMANFDIFFSRIKANFLGFVIKLL